MSVYNLRKRPAKGAPSGEPRTKRQNDKPVPSGNLFDLLPRELLQMILGFVGPSRYTTSLVLVCRAWREALSVDTIWMPLLKSWFGRERPTTTPFMTVHECCVAFETATELQAKGRVKSTISPPKVFGKIDCNSRWALALEHDIPAIVDILDDEEHMLSADHRVELVRRAQVTRSMGVLRHMMTEFLSPRDLYPAYKFKPAELNAFLVLAAHLGEVDQVDFFIECGASPHDCHAICVACRAQHAHVVAVLINEHGVDPARSYKKARRLLDSCDYHTMITTDTQSYRTDAHYDSPQPLLSALRSRGTIAGEVAVVRLLLEANASVGLNDLDRSDEEPILTYANSPEVAELLIAAGANVNAQSLYCETPFMMAPNIHVAHALLEHNADPNMFDYKSRNALHHALGDEEIDHDMLRFLVSAGCYLDLRTTSGYTPLAKALKVGDTEAIRILIEAKCNVTDRFNYKNRDVSYLTMTRSVIENVRLLVDAKCIDPFDGAYGAEALRYYCGDADIVRVLLEAQANPNIPAPDGRTALHSAAAFASVECVELLLQAKADPLAVDSDGANVLDYFACAGAWHNDVARLGTLLDCRRLVNQGRGDTPLHQLMACRQWGSFAVDVFKLLVGAGADVNARDDDGRTPIFFDLAQITALEPERVRLLIQHGADVNVVCKAGRTPLTMLAYHDDDNYPTRGECISLLLDAGAEPWVGDRAACQQFDRTINIAMFDYLRRRVGQYPKPE